MQTVGTHSRGTTTIMVSRWYWIRDTWHWQNSPPSRLGLSRGLLVRPLPWSALVWYNNIIIYVYALCPRREKKCFAFTRRILSVYDVFKYSCITVCTLKRWYFMHTSRWRDVVSCTIEYYHGPIRKLCVCVTAIRQYLAMSSYTLLWFFRVDSV